MLGLSLSLLRCKGSENQASTDRTPSKMKTPPAKNIFPCMSGMSLCPAFKKSWAPVFRDNCVDAEKSVPTALLFSPRSRSYACPMGQGLETLAGLGRTVFWNNRIDEICPEKPAPTAVHF